MSDAATTSKKKLSREERYNIKRIMKTNSTRDAIFLSTALFVILPIGLIFIAVSYNIYRQRKNFVNTHPGVSILLIF